MENVQDKNAEQITSLMIDKIASLETNWKQPWISHLGSNFLPQSINGRNYAGGNIFFLYLLCEKFNYQTPVFTTFLQAKNEGINIRKGEESFPVYYFMFNVVHKVTKVKITLAEYNALPDDLQSLYVVYVNTKYYKIFNLDQTNFAEVYPNKWKALKEKYSITPLDQGNDMYVNDDFDRLINTKGWVCPIHPKKINHASYKISSDIIELPLKSQFISGEIIMVHYAMRWHTVQGLQHV